MLGLGWTEMLVVGVVALIVIGPKDLPIVMNRLGKFIGAVRRMGNEFQREINKTTGLDQVSDLRRTLTEPLKNAAADITREFNKTMQSGAVVPSGVIAPKDPKVESVVDEIHAKVGMAPPPSTPPEAAAPVKASKPARKPRAKATPKTDAVTNDEAKVASSDDGKAAAEKKPAAPRRPRAPKPKAEA